MQSPSYLHATNLVTGGAVHHPDAESEDQPEVSQSPAGFSIIHTLHMCFGVSYFGYHTKPLAKYLTLATTLLFLTVLILMNFPCLFHCTFNIKHLFTSGLSPDFTSFIIIYLDLYHVIGSSLILIFRGYRIQKFFDRVDDYCRNFGVELVAAQKKKLTSISVRITVYNILHVVGEVLILIFLVEHKLIKKTDRWTGGFTMEKRALNSTMTGMTPTIELDERTSYFINLLLKAMIVLYSKMIESLIVYISSYVSLILKRLEVRYDKFIYAPKGGRSIEVAKVAYIEAQNLIKESDEVFSHTTFDPLFINVLIILIGIFEVTDGIGRRREIDVDDWHEMYNSFSAFFAIYMCCEFSFQDFSYVSLLLLCILYTKQSS